MLLPRLLLLAAVAGAVALAGCGFVEDDGPTTTRVRDVGPFTRIASAGSVDVRVHVGGAPSLRVRAGEKVIGDVRTEVRDGTLQVRYEHDGLGGGPVAIEASVRDLDGIEVSGSGDVDADGIDAPAFTLRSDGSADVALAGSVARLDLEMHGSGDADLASLKARDARVELHGSGDVDVRADERLDVDVEGSGDVRYHGRPQVAEHIDGSGDLSQAD
jgi:Putative auto-transporter adhesin, head GIN domain